MTWPSLRAPSNWKVVRSMVLLMKRTEPSPIATLTPPECWLRGGTTPQPQSWAPPGQQAPPALGYDQLGVVAALNSDWAWPYQPHSAPLLAPPETVLAAVCAFCPMVVSSAWVGKNLLAMEVKSPSLPV